ncbi:MAG: ATP-binding protein [Desulfovibrionaceae bacterium]|nr:ATP-binding protein [Desulfovibrionaceae bacterium]
MAYIISAREINHAFVEQQLAIASETIRLRLATTVNSELTLLLKLADTPIIREYFMEPDDPGLQAAAYAEFASYQQHFQDKLVFWVSDMDRIFHSTSYEAYRVDPSDPASYWYDMTLYWTERYNFNINYNPELAQRRLWINAPVFVEAGRGLRRPVGMIGTGIDMVELRHVVASASKDFDNNITLYTFNKSNEITLAAAYELIVNKVRLIDHLGDAGAEVTRVSRLLSAGESQSFIYGDNMYLVSSIPAMQWYLVVNYPLPGLLALNPALNIIFFGMLLIILFMFLAMNLFVIRLDGTLTAQNMKLLEANRKTEAASQAKSAFLAKMSHEIRTPMNAITGMAALALREDMPAAAREHVLTIKHAGANLLSIINDILDFSKIETGKLEIVPGDYLFSSLLNDVVSIIRMRAVDSPIRFVVNIDSDIPNALFGDEIRVRQVLLNLLSNAVKYTEKGFVSFTAIGEIIDESTVCLTMEVADSGKGIKQEDIGKLFEDFTQIDLVHNKGIEGTGLGLAITWNILKAMHGSISVHSEYGKGSTFTVTLPQTMRTREKLASVENPQEKSVLVYERREIYANSIVCTVDNLGVQCRLVVNDDDFYAKMARRDYPFVFVSSTLYANAKKILSQLGSQAKIVLLAGFGETLADSNVSHLAMPVHAISVANILNGVADSFMYDTHEAFVAKFTAPEAKVLVVDDINTNLKVAEGLLLPYHMQLTLCKSGPEAIELIKSNHYDLVFMDHMMPGMDGIEATSQIRTLGGEEPYYASVPIIALTANAVVGTREMFLKNGFNDFLPKPVDMTKLNAVLEKWIPQEKQQKLTEREKAAAVKECDADMGIAITGLDVNTGIAMTGGILKNYVQALAVFHQDGLEKIEEIRTCLETENLPLYVTYVHALKSAAASVGAGDLSDAAKSLEAAGRRGDMSFIKTHSTPFLLALEALLHNIREALPDRGGERQGAVNLEILKAELVKLKTALDAFDSAAIDAAVNNLQKFTQAADIGASVENILHNTLIGEYGDAVLLINALLMEVE